ncbi:response regulator [methane-oxidizing endosymbiont of Gigantopelta aegis]|uniref:response regulator n=1 Tax=methane-oxidizing endosymbiont of Gigantopelta aegis TaxID=2794938 RepID=UPI0018DD2E29|nr:response regulator transcription factor [methane-oxidizing endosymbiont of Gigantopelta aegis]
MNTKIKVLLVDDHAVVRAGFKLLLATSSNIEVIAEAERGEQAIHICQSSRPDIIVMDLSMPGIGGLETIKRLVQRDEKIKILVFSVHDEQVYIARALNAGAKGYISKNSAPEILAEAIEAIDKGQIYVEEGLLKQSSADNSEHDFQGIIETFSAREFDVFRLLAKGLTVHKIADELCLGYKTVANYATQIKKKLQVSSSAELAHIAIVLGIMKH